MNVFLKNNDDLIENNDQRIMISVYIIIYQYWGKIYVYLCIFFYVYLCVWVGIII